MKKRGLYRVISALLMAAVLVCTTAVTPWTTVTAQEENISIYTVQTAAELRRLAEKINDGEEAEAYIELAKDIVIEGDWTPLGKNAMFPFCGTLDGKGHSITMTVDDPSLSYFGFFGCLDGATVKNLTIRGEVYCSEPYAYVGGLAGRARGNVTIENCVNEATVSSLVRGCAGVGGMIGGYDANIDYDRVDVRMTLTDCVNRGLIMVTGSATDSTLETYVGGMVGSNSNCVQLTRCTNLGDICAPGATVGGLLGHVGYQTGDYHPSLSECQVEAAMQGAPQKTYRLYGKGSIAADNVIRSGENTALSGTDETENLLFKEALKYAAVFAVSSETEVGSTITLLKSGETPQSGITLLCSQGEKDLAFGYLTCDASGIRLAKENKTRSVITETATLQWTDANGQSLRKPITVHIYPAKADARQTLMDRIAKSYEGKSGEWVVFDMAVYEKLGFGENKTDKENYRNLTVNALAKDTALTTDRAKGEIILSALDTDTTHLTPYLGETAYSNPEKLRSMDLENVHYTAAPWILMAEEGGQVQLTEAQRSALIQAMADVQGENGLLYYTWNNEKYDDPDTTGTALAALARFYDTDTKVKTMVDAAIRGLSAAQGENGSYGNVNTDAMVICGLAAMGIQPSSDTRFVKNGSSLGDALLLYVDQSESGFTTSYGSGAAGEKAKELATEQGFRALIVLEKMESCSAFHVYSQKVVGGEKIESIKHRFTASAPGIPEEEAGESDTSQGGTSAVQDTVQIKVLGRKGSVWLSSDVGVSQGSTAAAALKKALKQAGIQVVGLEDGYIQSVTNGDQTLGQMDYGANSGWLYMINQATPTVGILDYILKDGDLITLYYTEDYTQEESAGVWNQSGKNHGTGLGGLTSAQSGKDEAETENGIKIISFIDVSADAWYDDVVQYVCQKGWMQGVSETEFAPEDAVSRAMFVTMLYRMHGQEKVQAMDGFTDVLADAWYTEAVYWAKENGIVRGVTETEFAPDAAILREEMAIILMRYAALCGFDVSENAEMPSFADVAEIAQEACGAVAYAVSAGLMRGNPDQTFLPKATATRAEAAAVLMRMHQKMNEK